MIGSAWHGSSSSSGDGSGGGGGGGGGGGMVAVDLGWGGGIVDNCNHTGGGSPACSPLWRQQQ